jgi:hypothetical protein
MRCERVSGIAMGLSLGGVSRCRRGDIHETCSFPLSNQRSERCPSRRGGELSGPGVGAPWGNAIVQVRCDAWGSTSSGGWAMEPVPVDDLCAGGGPHALAAHDVAQRLVQASDAERLADEPGVQV